MKAHQRGFRSSVSGGTLSTHMLSAILHHSLELGFNIERQMSGREDWFGRIHSQSKNLACTLSTMMISPLCTLPLSSAHKETAGQGSQEQTSASISHREHEPCSSVCMCLWSSPILTNTSEAHLDFLQWCYLASILSQKKEKKIYEENILSLKLLPQGAVSNFLRSFTPLN